MDHHSCRCASVACLSMSMFCAWGCSTGAPANAYREPPPPEVTVAKPIEQFVPIYIEENGETEAVDRVEIRARVSGELEEIRFQPGDEVKAGDPLFQIEDDEYQVAVNLATAAIETAAAAVSVAESQVDIAKAELDRSSRDFKRMEALFNEKAASQLEFDTALAAKESAEATLNAANAAVEQANAQVKQAEAQKAQADLNLTYTKIIAPISGKITKTAVKQNNLVQNGTVLATIVDRSSIYANFNISDRSALRLQKAKLDQQGMNEQTWHYKELTAELKREIDDSFAFAGSVDYINQEGVDQATGTLAIRAKFPNPTDEIAPGLFVRIRVPIPFRQKENSLLIPERALQRDQSGPYVLIINSENKAERHPVVTGQIVEGMVVIEDGIDPQSRVLIDGSQRVRPGVVVAPEEIQLREVGQSDSPDRDVPEVEQ